MTRYLLDTNIISNVTRIKPSDTLLAWMAEQDDADLFVSALTIAELHRGVLEKPAGRKRRELEQWFAGPDGPLSLFVDRVLPFDAKAALAWGHLMAQGTRSGQPRSALDMVIAATAVANDCVVVTNDEKHFAGIEIVNPLRARR